MDLMNDYTYRLSHDAEELSEGDACAHGASDIPEDGEADGSEDNAG